VALTPAAARSGASAPAPPPLREIPRAARASDGQRLALVEVALPGPRRPRSEVAFLLLHGFAQNRRSFTLGPLPGALLERGARVFVGELRGHGESRVERGHAWSLRTHLELDCPALLAAVRGEAGVERVHLVGHSMGGLLGCALLATGAPLASLLAVASPIVLGAGRPLVRLASLVAGPFATLAPRHHRVPIHRVLAALARPLSRPDARGASRLLQRATGLANPAAAPPEALRAVLASADPESPAVFEELARNAVLARPRLAGVDLVTALRASPLPVAAVVGSRDVFAPRAAVAPLDEPGHAGPRLVVEVPGATHVDVAIGHHVPATVARLWDFLVRP
jgi:pimeloyl-ACP methyl ester carboxylesterase